MAEESRQRLWRSTEVLEAVSAHPEQFLSVQEGLASELSSLTKALYDFHRTEAVLKVGSPLNELIIENFDEEQIWQQLELQNNAVLGHFKDAIRKTVKDRDLYILQVSEDKKEEEEPEEEEGSEEEPEKDEEGSEEEPGPISGNDDLKECNSRLPASKKSKKSPAVESFSDEDSDMDFDIDKLKQQNKKKNLKIPVKRSTEKSIVDDQFFKLSEMEAFLEAAEKEDGRDEEEDDEEEEEVDYFKDIDSDLEDDDEDNEDEEELFQMKKTRKLVSKSARDLQYQDYFDPVEGDETEKDGQVGEQSDKSDEDDKAEDGEELSAEEDMNEASELDEYDEEEDMMEETEESKKAKEAFKRVTFDLSDGSEGEDVGDILGGKKNQEKPEEVKSSFEKREEKMSEKIQTLQKQMLEEKSWQLSGEVTSQKRPENSLLSESLLFDHASRMAPTITEETTLQLEDIIKQRIKEQVWDDVVRKEKPKEDAFEYKKRLTLDHDKSKLSLAEIYEQEYLKLNQKKVEEEENPKHVEIQKLMDSLFLKLDALSNFHFTPKPAVPDIKVVSNLPAISMEEVAPVGVSEAALLAPEEIKEKNKAGDLKTNVEKTATDKKRDRRKKKAMKKFKIKEKEKRQKLIEKQRAEKGKKPTKEMTEANIKKLTKEGKATVLKDEGKDKALKSSQAFFSQLQDQVRTQIKGAKSANKKPKKNKELSAHKLKL